jgi:predicted ATPase
MIEGVSALGFKSTLVKLHCMDKDSVNQAMSNLLHLSPRLVRSLSDIVYNKTKGNPLFFSRMLLALNREGFLRISLTRHRWVWDEDKIQSRELPEDVAMLFVNSINKLPEDVKAALGTLSCFGASIDCDVIHAIESDLSLKLIDPLSVAMAEGLVSKLDGRYHFCHDRIQEAVYSMIEGEC